MSDCVHHFAQEIENGPIVCRNCGATPIASATTVNVQSTNSTAGNVLQGCGCLVIVFVIVIALIIII